MSAFVKAWFGKVRQGLRPVYKRRYRNTTDSDHALPVAPNVIARQFDGWAPDQAWVGDVTYVATQEGWLYLAAMLDLGSRRIVGWSMNDRMTSGLVCDALKAAYWQRKPAPGLIMHTDRLNPPNMPVAPIGSCCETMAWWLP